MLVCSLLSFFLVAGPLPRFAGINIEPPRPVPAASPPPPFGGPVRVPPLNPEDVAKFTALFDKSETQGGLITGKPILSGSFKIGLTEPDE